MTFVHATIAERAILSAARRHYNACVRCCRYGTGGPRGDLTVVGPIPYCAVQPATRR